MVTVPRIAPTETIATEPSDEPTATIWEPRLAPVVVTETLFRVNSTAAAALLTVFTVIVSVRVVCPVRVAVAPVVVSVVPAPQVSAAGKVNVNVSLAERLPPGRFAGSVIEIGLTDVVPVFGNVTAGEFAETVNHDTLALVGTLNDVAGTPSVA